MLLRTHTSRNKKMDRDSIIKPVCGGLSLPWGISLQENHPKVKIRKSAIYCLGDSGDSRARDALIEIIRKK